MFTLVKSEAKPLTRELVNEFVALPPSPVERDLNPKRLKFLHEMAMQGKLVPFHWATAKLGDVTYRVNGQHSSTMLSTLNGSFPENLTVHLDEYVTDTEDGLALLFRQMDARQSQRTTADVAGAYQGLVPKLRSVPKKTAKLGVEGVIWYNNKIVGMPTPKGDDIYTLMNDLRLTEFLQWLGDLISDKTPEFRNVPVVAAVYGTYDLNPEEARSFWEAVARGGNGHNDPEATKVLGDWLMAKRKETKKNAKNSKPANFFQGSIYAWNGYRENKPVKDIRASTDKGFYGIQN